MSINASPSSLEPSFNNNNNTGTTSVSFNSENTVVETEMLTRDASSVQHSQFTSTAMNASTKESSAVSTCHPTNNQTISAMSYLDVAASSTVSKANNMQITSTVQTLQTLSKLQQMVSAKVTRTEFHHFMTSSSSSSVSIITSSAHMTNPNLKTKNTNSSDSDQRSYIFALVFGIFGGILVLGIAALILKNVHTKSKNRVKKIKKPKTGDA